jgi:hypothetical protein
VSSQDFVASAMFSFFFIEKAYFQRNRATIHDAEDPILALLESIACITGEMAQGWFKHAGYTFE